MQRERHLPSAIYGVAVGDCTETLRHVLSAHHNDRAPFS